MSATTLRTPGRYLQELRKDLASGARIARTSGPGAVVKLAATRVAEWVRRDREWLGRLVEISGNRVRLDGARFDVSHPQISTIIRARLLRGNYERAERVLLRDWLDPDAPVIELGGGIGVVATVLNRHLTQPDRHVVVEANAALIPVLERQRALNDAAFVIEHGAIDYAGAPAALFTIGRDFISARVGGTAGTSAQVPAMTLGGLLRKYPWTGATFVCDIEGAETYLVQNEGELLARHFNTLIIELHPKLYSAAVHDDLLSRLHELGFVRVGGARTVHAFRRTARNAAPNRP